MDNISTYQWAILKVKFMITKNDKHDMRQRGRVLVTSSPLMDQIHSSMILNRIVRRIQAEKRFVGVDRPYISGTISRLRQTSNEQDLRQSLLAGLSTSISSFCINPQI